MERTSSIGKAIGRELARAVLNEPLDNDSRVNPQALFNAAVNYAEQLKMSTTAKHIERLRKQFEVQFADFSTSDNSNPELLSNFALPEAIKSAIQEIDEPSFEHGYGDNQSKIRVRSIIGPSFGGITEELSEIGPTSFPELKESFCLESKKLLGLEP